MDTFRAGIFFVCIGFQTKTKSLEETLRLHRFYNSCHEFESWMEDKENILNTFSADGDNVEVVQAKYEVKTSLGPIPAITNSTTARISYLI